jgi:uncharacterized protein YbaR (Trm112 family)
VRLSCPNCRHRPSHPEVLKFFLLQTIACPRCSAPLSINGRGRAAIMISPLAALLVGALLQRVTGSDIALPVMVIAGFIVSPILGARLGSLFVAKDDLR